METHIASTPFGSRPMSLALLAAQRDSRENLPEGKAVDKWQLYKHLCEGKTLLGVNDRSLAVLSALLSFYPDSELSEANGLIVFPSNKQLSLRAHGMPHPTLRRHLAALVATGLILRRDSPNGKRYAHKGRAGDIEEAFGFSLAPLLIRADEIRAAAKKVHADDAALRLTRERVSLQRRDIYKMIEVALQEGLPGDWKALWTRFRNVVDAIPRRASLRQLATILAELTALRDEVDNILIFNEKDENISGNDAHNERQQSESDTELYYDSEPLLQNRDDTGQPQRNTIMQQQCYPIQLVLKACPDIVVYGAGGISNWRDLMITAAQVRRYLGISPSAYNNALDLIGHENTAVVIAYMLQRTQHISSPGGYLRALTKKAGLGEFSVGPMLMAALRTNGPIKEAFA